MQALGTLGTSHGDRVVSASENVKSLAHFLPRSLSCSVWGWGLQVPTQIVLTVSAYTDKNVDSSEHL